MAQKMSSRQRLQCVCHRKGAAGAPGRRQRACRPGRVRPAQLRTQVGQQPKP